MRPDDYRLVFLTSDSSCREDTEDSSSTASSAAPPAVEDCDWDYFEPGAAAAAGAGSSRALPCPRACSCGAEPRFVAVPVPVPVPVPAALWPALLAFPPPTANTSPPADPPPPHWTTYPGFPPLDAAALARLTTAAAAVAAASAEKIHDKTDKAIQSDAPPKSDNDAGQSNDNVDNAKCDSEMRRAIHEVSDEIKVIACDEVVTAKMEVAPEHLAAENAFDSSDDSGESSDNEGRGARGSYDLTSGAPEEPPTTDEDSEDSGGGGGRFSRVFVVNPVDSSSDVEDNADSSGIDCDDVDDKSSDNLEVQPADVDKNIVIVEFSDENENSGSDMQDDIHSQPEIPVILYDDVDKNNSCVRPEFIKFCDDNMLQHQKTENIEIRQSESEKFLLKERTFNMQSPVNDDIIETTVILNDRQSPQENILESESSENHKLSNVPDVISRPRSSSPIIQDNFYEKNHNVEKIDLLKGIERKLSELLKKESLAEEQAEVKPDDAVGSSGEEAGCAEGSAASAPVAVAVSRSRPAREDGARFTSRVMITHDRVSVVTSDTTRVMQDVTVHHTNSSRDEPGSPDRSDDHDQSDDESASPSGGVTVVSNSDTLSAVVCLEEGLADDDSWVEDVSHDEDAATSTDSDSADEMTLQNRGEEFVRYCRRSLDFTLHTIVEESCEESEAEHITKKPRPISATELEKYFFFGLGDGRHVVDDDDHDSDTSSVCSEGGESIVDTERPERDGDNEELVSSRLEKYFLSGFMGFTQERRESDGSGSVGSDSEGGQSPEQRRKRLVRARGTPRSHSSSLDNLLTGEELSVDAQEVSDGSSTETEDRHDSSERLDAQNDSKRKKQSKKTRGSPADERRLSTEYTEEGRDDTRSVSEGEDGRSTPRQEFPPLGSELSESKKQTSRDSGFVGSCDDLLRNGDSASDFARTHEPKVELEEIIEEIRPEIEEKSDGPTMGPPSNQLIRKDSFNNWSSDEETNVMMTKMRQFFKQMIASTSVRTSTPSDSSKSESTRPPKPPQLLYFESELTRLMKTVPGIRDEEVREIVEYLSSEDTWSDSYDSSDYAGSDLEGAAAGRSALRKQISESCREIIDEFDRGGNSQSLERDAAGAYHRLAATLGRAGEGSPPLFGKVMRHIGGRLKALMHEVSGGASPSTDDDSASEPGALARSRSHDVLEPTASRASVASDSERFSWRGSFESALLAADSRGTLGGNCEARRSPAGAELAAQRSHSRSCGAIGGSEDRLWRGRRRASAPDAEVTFFSSNELLCYKERFDCLFVVVNSKTISRFEKLFHISHYKGTLFQFCKILANRKHGQSRIVIQTTEMS